MSIVADTYRFVVGVAGYESFVAEFLTEDLLATLDATIPRFAQAVADDRLADAARVFSELVANDDELAARRIRPDRLCAAGQALRPCSAAVWIAVGWRRLLQRRETPRHRARRRCTDSRDRRRRTFRVAFEPEAIAEEVTRFFTAPSVPT